MSNIFIIAAENSAENYGSQVIDEFKKRNPETNFFGVGGEKFTERGVDLIIHNREFAIVGLIEVISSILKLKKYMKLIVNETIKRNTDAVLLIDYPDFNLRLAKKFKNLNIPVYYYISPTVWAWRYSRVKLIKKYIDHLFIIFPFEIDIFKKEKIPFTYTGHPLISSIKITEKKETFKKKLRVENNELIISLLPGSRKSEVVFLLPEMLKAIKLIKKLLKIKIFIQKADSIEKDLLLDHLKKTKSEYIQIIDQKQGYNLINASDIVITTCGTSNLEIAMIGVPFIAVYRVNKLSYFLGKRFVKINLYSIVNILAQKRIIPELIQRDFKAKNIVAETLKLLGNKRLRNETLHQFKNVKNKIEQDKNSSEIIYKKIYKDLLKINKINT